MTLVYKYLSKIYFHNSQWPGGVMIRVFNSQLRDRRFDSRSFWFLVSLLETLCIFAADLKILHMYGVTGYLVAYP